MAEEKEPTADGDNKNDNETHEDKPVDSDGDNKNDNDTAEVKEPTADGDNTNDNDTPEVKPVDSDNNRNETNDEHKTTDDNDGTRLTDTSEEDRVKTPHVDQEDIITTQQQDEEEEEDVEEEPIDLNSLDFNSHLKPLIERLTQERDWINECPLKNYKHIKSLKRAIQRTKSIAEKWEQFASELTEGLVEVRETSQSIFKILEEKLSTDGLNTWIENGSAFNTQSDEDKAVQELKNYAQAANARKEITAVNADLAAAVKLANEAETEAAEAALEAERAANEVEQAREAAEEARRAAIAKARFEEEERRRMEEERKAKEEYERQLKMEEERKRAELEALKGTPEEQARIAEEEERQRQEAARRDPKNWEPYFYRVKSEDWDQGMGCVIRAMKGVIYQEDLICEKLSQLDDVLQLAPNEELVSNIIRISKDDPKKKINFEEPFHLAIPQCAPRMNNPTKEPIIKILDSKTGEWKPLQTKEVQFEDMKELKFVEAKIKRMGTFAVVLKFKKDQITVTKKGGKFFSSIDSRICMGFSPGAFRVNTNIQFEVQPVDLAAVSDLKMRQVELCGSLLASSPILKLWPPKRKCPMTFTLPVPPNPMLRAKRPGTAVEKKENKSSVNRPKSAFPLKNKDADDTASLQEDNLHLLYRNAETDAWEAVSNVVIAQGKNKDTATFEVDTPLERFVVLRTQVDTPVPKVEKMAKALDEALCHRVVQVVLQQNNDDPGDICMNCVNLNKVDKTLKQMSEAGYEEGPSPSDDIILKEGQIITLSFRGNICRNTEYEDDFEDEDTQTGDLKFCFNSHLKSKLEFYVTELDKFAQKGINCYRGFAQFNTRGLIPREVAQTEDDRGNRSGGKAKTQIVYEEGNILLCEMLINLPKPEQEAPKPIIKAPVTFKSEDLVDDETLRHLSTELGEEWKRLASQLNVKGTRIQAILRDNVNAEATDQAAFDMLVTWAKRVPRSMNKVDILCNALLSVGRVDLVEEIRDREREFRETKAASVRDSYLKRAFVIVAQSPSVVNQWQEFVSKLGLSRSIIQSVDDEYSSMREKCFNSLLRWKEENQDEATTMKLSLCLRKCKHLDVCRQVEGIAGSKI
ncbi:unnamed protein product [Owenia fusiformis]|uniref:Uncharacterized protein n=1 Tax=Owenia fusiformis TaxID=6347 RepID=A0A8J1TB71_OWEFU|nr:unnamed protein product [Owenia fusiformis]